MGVLVETAKLPSLRDLEVEIPTTASSMSQGFHKENLFSFSDEFERSQHNHIAQHSRRDKLREQQQNFEAAAAAAAATSVAAGHSLVPIQEEEEEDGGIYGPAGTSNMLSEMFNFPAPASELHLIGQGAGSTAAGYHRLIQQRPADSFYGCMNRSDEQVLLGASGTSWSSVLGEDSAAAVVKHRGMNPESPTPMRHFFVNSSSSAAGVIGIEAEMQQLPPRPPSPPPTSMGGSGVVRSLHHHHHHHHSQTFLGSASFGEGLNLVGVGGGSIMERQLGASLSLSSSELLQLEMRKAENQMIRPISRSEQGGRFFLNSGPGAGNEDQEDEVHPSSAHGQLQATQPDLLQQQACRQLGQQAHMSYGPSVATLSIFRNSMYARAAQELLEEFCSVGRGHVRAGNRGVKSSSINIPNPSQIRGGASRSAGAAPSSSSKDIPPLSSADRFENQRKKAKLLSMLDEVERRYNHYCEQMQMVVSSFDSVMGFGAATPYTALAQKAMSRHFRCLKDAITGQLRQTCELLGDKEGAINGPGGLTKGETPKLRLIDQSLRQQRAFHQLGMMDQDQAWRPQRGLPDRSVTILRAWLFDHFLHPYPSDADKHLLARQTGLSRNQVSNWFINARVRLWKPMVEDMYQQEAKDAEDSQQQQQHNDHDETNSHSVILAAATTRRHQSMSPTHNPTLVLQPRDSNSPECVPMPIQNLCALAPPINTHSQPPPAEDDDATPSALIFSPGPLHSDMYRRPAPILGPSAPAAQPRFGPASTAARTGDLSLTLGLRHAGVNPPETGRFGL